MSGPVAFEVLGRPVPQGSKRPVTNRATGRIMLVEQLPRLAQWRDHVQVQAVKAMRGQPVFDGAVEVWATFCFARPKAHYRTGRYSTVVKVSAPWWPTTAVGDVDKLCRAILDSITGPMVANDGQVAVLQGRKLYSTPERAEITVIPMHKAAELAA